MNATYNKLLYQRKQNKSLSWAAFISSLTPEDARAINKLRSLIVNKMYHFSFTFKDRYCSTAATPLQTPAPGGQHICPMGPFKKIKKLDQHGTQFLLNMGSVKPESNVDLTLVNANAINDITKIVEHINATLGKRFNLTITQDVLKHWFDINFYVNTFLLLKCDTFFYLCCNTRKQRIMQRQHATNRLFNRKPIDIRNIDYYLSMIQKLKNTLSEVRVCKIVDAMSMTTYFSDDAYHSQGGFLHVLLEIQSGVDCKLHPDQYLDSAYDNLGLLQYKTNGMRKGKVLHKHFNKYVTRIVHALKRVQMLAPRTSPIIKDIVTQCDMMSKPNPKAEFLACSIGKKTITHRCKANDLNNTFQTIMESKSNQFSIPNRLLTSQIDPFIAYMHSQLDRVQSVTAATK